MNLRAIALCAAALGCFALACSTLQAADEPVATLLSNLSSANESTRVQAIDQLGDRGAKAAEAVAPLTALLQDKSAKVRAHAAWALGAIGAAAKPAAPALIELLKDSDETVRHQAVRAVMHIKPGAQVTVPLCVKLLEDPDPGVRIRVLAAITEAGPQGVQGLIDALKDDRTADDYWACLALREMGRSAAAAIPALVEKLQKDSRPDIRREAMLALAAMDDAAIPAIDAIAAALPDQHTRTAATFAMGRIGRIPPAAEATVRANVKSDDKTLSVTSLWALARMHPEDKQFRAEATEQLIARLKDADPFVRAAAARALASLPPAPEITASIWGKALQDADETTVQYALDAMVAMGGPAVPRLVDALKYEKLRGKVVYVLGRIGRDAAPAAPALAKLIDDKNENLAREAVLALANIGPGAKDAVPALVAGIQKTDNPNACPIAYALGSIGPDAAQAEPVLTDLLENQDRKLALASAWALVHIRPAQEVAAKTIPVLMAGLQNDMPLARQGAAEALGELGPSASQATSALKKAAKDDDPAVRAAAEKALDRIAKRPGGVSDDVDRGMKADEMELQGRTRPPFAR